MLSRRNFLKCLAGVGGVAVLFPSQTINAEENTGGELAQEQTSEPKIKIKLEERTFEVGLDDPLFDECPFTWRQATHDGKRIPNTEQIYNNFMLSAFTLTYVMKLFFPEKNPQEDVGINSWYRPSHINRRTRGAARNSSHLRGAAIDFYIKQVRPKEIYQKLDSIDYFGGLIRYYNRIHLDVEKKKRKIIS